MTIEEFYRIDGGSYEDMLFNFKSDEKIKKIFSLFLKDDSFASLKKAVAAKDNQAAYRACHTLKGVSLNMRFKKLSDASIDLLAILKNGLADEVEASFNNLNDIYDLTVAMIAECL